MPRPIHSCAGYFQPEAGQFGCLSCDVLGDFYQEQEAQVSCEPCAENAQRYIGVLSAVNKSSCQCKNGATFDAFCRVQLQRLQLLCCAGYYNRDNRLGEVRP